MDTQVLQVLSSTLSPQPSVRAEAEGQLKHLFTLPEGGLSLARILCNHEVPLPQRQISPGLLRQRFVLMLYSAGILLQQYINKHWTPVGENFEPPMTERPIKAQLREIVFTGLSDPTRKIRGAAAFATSSIARFEWPEEWPELLGALVALLNDGREAPVDGGMRVVAELVRNDLSEDQLVPVVRDLAPALLRILGDPSTHGCSTRAQTINVFRQILKMLETVKEEHPAAVKQAMDGLASVWLSAFEQLLAQDAGEEVKRNWESLSLRFQIFKTLSTFIRAFKSYLTPHLTQILNGSLWTLQSLTPIFSTYYLSTSPDAPEPPSATSDTFNTDTTDLQDVICAIFDFLTPLVRSPKLESALVNARAGPTDGLRKVVELALDYNQVTRENAEDWMDDPNEFIAHDEEDYSLRTTAQDLVGACIDKWPGAVTTVLAERTSTVLQTTSVARQSGDEDWWKPLESLLAMLSGLAEDIRDHLDSQAGNHQPRTLDLPQLLEQVIPGVLSAGETPFLQGRAFIFASQFAALLPASIGGEYLAAAVAALEGETEVPVKISAVKTIKNFCRHLSPELLRPSSPRILSLLLPLLPSANNETLYLLMETLQSIMSISEDSLPPEMLRAVVEQSWGVWVRCSTDPVLTAIVEELYEALSTRPSFAGLTTSLLTPHLAFAITTPVNDDTIHVPGEAIQLANALLRPRGDNLDGEFVGKVCVGVMDVLRGTDDMDVIQHGMIHLTLVVRKDCDKLVQWHDTDGTNGIARIFGLLGRFLAPHFSESGGIFVGELIMHLFRKAGSSMAPVLPDLLRAIVGRLGTAQLPSFIQSLVLPFAYLFSTEHTLSTIDLLSSIPSPSSHLSTSMPSSSEGQGQRTGLDVVLGAWCETSETISGSWNIRVSDLGMAKLFTLHDGRVTGVMVKGDLIVDETNRDTIMTRSRTKTNPSQYTSIPFPLKALKLLLKDVQALGSGKGTANRDLDVASDDGDDDWADDGDDPLVGVDGVGEFGFLSSWLDAAGPDTDAQDDDEDLKADPIAQVDLGAHLVGVLRECYTTNSNGMHEMVGGLNDTEKGILRGVLTIG